MDVMGWTFWNNTLTAWAIALGVALVVTLGARLALGLLLSRLKKLAARTSNNIDDAILEALGRTRTLSLLVIGLAAGTCALELSDSANRVVRIALVIVLLVQGGLWIVHAVTNWLKGYRERQLESDRGAATAVGAVAFVVQLMVWVMVLLIALANLGIDITALITGLGIGGIAIALALQNVLGDLFASLSIVFDKPFVIGDFVIIGDHLGVVENVGLKTTRIRSLSGEQLVFSNSDLLNSRIRNFGRMFERRVAFTIGVTYQTSQEHLKLIPTIIREAITSQEQTRFDRSNFAKFGNFSLDFESVYYISGPDYNLYMNIQEQINLQIRERFLQEGIEFAYPTQTLFLERPDQMTSS